MAPRVPATVEEMSGWISRRNVLQLGVAAAAGAAGVAVALGLRGDDDEPAADGTDVRVGSLDVFVVDRPPSGRSAGTVLFLHGGSYTSSVWDRTGILDSVRNSGWRAVAIDLPGHGKTAADDVDPPRFLEQVLSIVAPLAVVVSPSASGRYSLPLVSRNPELVAGFVPVAPVGLQDFAMASGVAPPPSLVVWGTRDAVINPRLEAPFAAKLHGTEAPMQGAGHAPYEERPAEFERLLQRFLTTLG